MQTNKTRTRLPRFNRQPRCEICGQEAWYAVGRTYRLLCEQHAKEVTS